MKRLDEKVAIVTGAGQGVGRGIALAFAKEGAKVVIAVRNTVTGPEVVREIESVGGAAVFSCCDVSKKIDVARTVEEAVAAFGGVDILVNNAHDLRAIQQAGVRGQLMFADVTDEVLRGSFESGFMGTVWFMKACLPHMKGRGGGRIINLGSLAGIRGDAGLLTYNAAKEAIRAATRTAAREWGQYGITVNCICPAADAPSMTGEYAAAITSGPMRRLGSCENDVGRTAVFLSSDDASYLTGLTINVDGGLGMDAGR
jgi:NAD(P)-dependent dehydrogenase (short-subunit alcohol dehydrogenase family)